MRQTELSSLFHKIKNSGISPLSFLERLVMRWSPGGVLPIMAYTERLRPKGVPFSGFRYIKG